MISRPDPISGINFCAAAGNTVLPIDPPIAAYDIARPRFLSNQCEMTTSAGPTMTPQQTPRLRPCTRINCQNRVHSAVMKADTTITQLAAKHGILKYPRSNIRPVASAGKYMSAY